MNQNGTASYPRVSNEGIIYSLRQDIVGLPGYIIYGVCSPNPDNTQGGVNATNLPIWQIFRMNTATNTTEWADYARFTQIWDNRLAIMTWG
jgi:hypothetical protein